MWSTVGFIKLQKMEHKVFSAAFKICIFAFTFWVHHVQLLFPLTFNLCTLSLNFLCFVTALSAVCILGWLICVPGVHAVCTHVFIFQQNRSIFILTVIRHCKQSTFLFSFLFFFFCFYCLFPTSVYLVMCVQLYQIRPFHEVKPSVWSHLVLGQ